MDEKEQSVEIGTDKSEETLLTQWQTCVEMANAVSQRRDAMNNLFVTLNLAIVAAASFIWDAKTIMLLVSGILQNTDNGSSRPFAVLTVRVAALGVRKSVIPLILQRREDAQAVEFFRDMKGAESFQTLSENIPHHIGGIRIDLQALVLFPGLKISIHRERADKIAAAPFGFQGASCLYRYVAAICLVHNVLDRDRQIVRRVIYGIYIVVDRDKADTVSREYPSHVAACFDILTAKS